MDKEMQAFCDTLLESVKQMKAGKAARTTTVSVPDVIRARNNIKMSQSDFATLIGVSVRTLQAWEQGKRTPSGAARTLIRVAEKHPDILLEAVQ
ncbi:helix-turn-helix domain-containing protein [Oxalobacter sp. OxGP1]|uniref:helix-turn-helix domain-containing protein n=1 Tax=Oxalobacter paeniformigenes TaxID=2946594 RepID=UPI0022B04BF3|nr:helix-turn-helix domain-containing protein [Oxalobacter paeniformigenes]MCZ4053228.1 helix-turn-helix domain-containing protein [Oxalobacter paeniformigenes]